MKPALRLLIDECCSPRLPRELRERFTADHPGLEIRYVPDAYRRGALDPEWLAPLKDDAGWIVLTKDAGRKSQHHKLPKLCEELRVTHVALTSGLIARGYEVYKAAVLAVWPQLFDLHRLQGGTKVKLGFVHTRDSQTAFALRIGTRSLASVLAERQRNGQGEGHELDAP